MMLEWLMELNGDKDMKVLVHQELKGWLLLLLSLGDITNNPAQHLMYFFKSKEMVVVFIRLQYLTKLPGILVKMASLPNCVKKIDLSRNKSARFPK